MLAAAAGAFAHVDQHYLLQARQMQALSFAAHIPLVCYGIAFPAMVLFAEWLGHRTGDPVHATLARRWSKIMLALFAVGVVTGTILSLELGLLWPNFMATFGAVLGLGFAIELNPHRPDPRAARYVGVVAGHDRNRCRADHTRRHQSGLYGVLPGPRSGRSEHHGRLGERDADRPGQHHRSGHANRLGKRCLHQPHLRRLQRHSRTQGQAWIDQAGYAPSACVRLQRQRKRGLILRRRANHRRQCHFRRRSWKAVVHRHLPSAERRSHDLVQGSDELLAGGHLAHHPTNPRAA
jgi:Cytochrome bd terminal oxidase subunit I